MYECEHYPKTTELLEKELFQTRADVRRLQEEITAWRNKAADLTDSLCQEKNLNKMSKRKLEDTAKCNEIEKRTILFKQDELLGKIRSLEETVECMNKRVQEVISDNACWQSKYNSLKEANKRLENSKRSAEKTSQDLEQELHNTQCRVKVLEDEKRAVIGDIYSLKNENQSLKQKFTCLENEKCNLKQMLECSKMELRKLENENSKKYRTVTQLEEKISRLNCELSRFSNDESRAQKEILRLKNELQKSLEEKKKLVVDNKKLNGNMECLKKELELKESELKKACNEIARMNDKRHEFAQKFQRMETFLDTMERERIDQTHMITQQETKIMNLESIIKNLESEKNAVCNCFQIAQEKIKDLQMAIKTKDSFISDMENQIKELSCNLHKHKNELSKLYQKNMVLKNEVETGKELVSNMECQKKQYEGELREMNMKLESLNNDIFKSQLIIKDLTCQLEIQKSTIASLESTILETRKEAHEETIQNLSVHQKVQELQNSVDTLQEKLCNVNNALSKCQSTCSEIKSHNNELEFQLTNERYATVLSGEVPPSDHKASYNPCADIPPDRHSKNCHCGNKMEDCSKSKYEIKSFGPVNEIAKYDYGKGMFSISVNDCFQEESGSYNFTALDNTKTNSIKKSLVRRNSDSSIAIEQSEKFYRSNKISESKSIFDNYPKTSLGHTQKDFKSNKNDLQGILKERVFPNRSPSYDAIHTIYHPKERKIEMVEKNYSNSTNIFDTDTSDFSSVQFMSIVEEGPIYKVAKKCYKKTCYSGSEEDTKTKVKYKI